MPRQTHAVTDAIRILLVDDQPEQLRLMRAMLAAHDDFQLNEASDGEEALACIVKLRPHYVITDINMPRLDGLGLCTRIRDLDLKPYPHITLVSADTSPNRFAECLQAGADLFLPKPFDAEDLMACLRAGSRLHDLHELIERAANIDSLTNLPMRNCFDHDADREFKRSSRYGTPLSCAILDVDFFKRINDTHGHAAGDAVLQHIADIVRESVRCSDLLCRYGGEEFCILLPETVEADANNWAERVRERICQSPVAFEDKLIQVTASIGIAQARQDCTSSSDLISKADEALLIAKGSGRNRVITYEVASKCGFENAFEIGTEPQDFWSIPAGRLMTTVMATLDRNETLERAAELFLRFRVNAAPVIENNELVGIISEKDVMQRMQEASNWEVLVEEAMNRNVICYSESTPVQMIHDFFCRVAIHRVVITRDNLPVGIVARGTILRAYRNWRRNADLSVRREDFSAAKGEILEVSQAISQAAEHIQLQLSESNRDHLQVLINSTTRIQEFCKDLLSTAREHTSKSMCECID